MRAPPRTSLRRSRNADATSAPGAALRARPPLGMDDGPAARHEQRLAVVGPPLPRLVGPFPRVGEVAGEVLERRHAPEDDRLGIAHCRAVRADQPEAAPLGDREPARRNRVEVLVGRARPQRRDLLETRPAADVPVDQLLARRAERGRLEDPIEAARSPTRHARPPCAQVGRLPFPGVLPLEDRRPAVPAVHLPEVDDARPVAGRARLLPDADERAALATPCSPRGGMSLVRFRTGADDVDRLVEVELPVRHAARHSRAAGRANSRAVRAARPPRSTARHGHVPAVAFASQGKIKSLAVSRNDIPLRECYSRTSMWMMHTLPPPIMWQRPTRASFTCRRPASPRSWSVVSQIWARPVGPPGWPRAMSPPSVDTGTRPPGAKLPRSIAASASPSAQRPSSS